MTDNGGLFSGLPDRARVVASCQFDADMDVARVRRVLDRIMEDNTSHTSRKERIKNIEKTLEMPSGSLLSTLTAEGLDVDTASNILKNHLYSSCISVNSVGSGKAR